MSIPSTYDGDSRIAKEAARRAYRDMSPSMREALLSVRFTRWGPLVYLYDIKRQATADACVRREVFDDICTEPVPGVCYPVTPWGLMVREAGTRTPTAAGES